VGNRLEEFLRRRARLQRVEEEVRRRVVLGFFDTLYWSRKFKRHMEQKRAARMTFVPDLNVPDILVDDEDDRARAAQSGAAQQNRQTMAAPGRAPSTFLSADDAARQAHHRSWSGHQSVDISLHDTSYGHPLSAPRSGGMSSSVFGNGPASPTTPGSGGLHHRHNASANSFELQEGGSQPGSNASSRRGSAVSPAQARELLDDSVWMESIRRSTTQRKSGWGPGYQ